MLITRKKLFFRSSLVRAKRTKVSKFPATIRTDDKTRPLLNAMPSALEDLIIVFGNPDVFFRLEFTAAVSLIF